jgi:serine/threonine protein kinase
MILANRYKLNSRLNRNDLNLCQVFRGINILTKEEIVVKIESCESEIKLLKTESMIYYYLKNMSGILPIKWFGSFENCLYMVLPYKPHCLSEFMENKNPQFHHVFLSTILSQIIEIVKSIHEKGIVHRDLKPDNVLLDEKLNVFVIDFGFSRKYMSNGKHIENKQQKSLIGTRNYASINVHERQEPSRRDDMESIGYIMLKTLPWINEVDEKKIVEMKRLLTHEFFQHTRSLDFDETPDYELLLSTLK